MDYAIIKLGNKQHRVRDGETLVVDRLPAEEGESFEPVVLLGSARVTAKVLTHGRGPKILIGKYRRRTGYKRHNGFRAATTQVEITIGAGGAKKAAAGKPGQAPAAEPVEVPQTVEAPETEATETVASETVTPEPSSAGLPAGYEELTVAQINAGAKGWSSAELAAALVYEQAHAARKGAINALESAIGKEGEHGA